MARANRTRSRRRERKFVPRGKAYISSTFNNTAVTLTDPEGNVIAWDSAGRPANEGLHIRAYLHEADYVASPNEIVVHKERTKLVLHWS